MSSPTSMTPGAAIVVSLSAANAQSAAIGTANSAQPTGTTTCRLVSTVDAWVAVGVNPTAVVATAGSMLLPASSVEYLDIPFGSKIGAVAESGGYLSITPMTKG